ncbi:MAG: hypothetical protein ACLT74_11505 [Christensenellales bacterium]
MSAMFNLLQSSGKAFFYFGCGLLVSLLLDFLAVEGFASVEATKGLSGRPLETFGASHVS